jgi:CBS-domain-containing membrane protein
LQELPRDTYATVDVRDVMGSPPIRVDAGADAFETLARLGQRDADYALVEANGEVVGTVSQESFFAAVRLRQGLG